MSSYTVTITEPGRAAKWREMIGSTTVPIASELPEEIGSAAHNVEAYRINVDALNQAQRQRLYDRCALNWEMPVEEAAHFVTTHGLYIAVEHCLPPQPTPQPDAPDRTPRRGEIQVSGNDTPDCCYSCGAPILWHHTKTGRAIPLSVRTIEQDAGGRRFALSHFADCPNANQHRGKPRHLTGRNGKQTNVISR